MSLFPAQVHDAWRARARERDVRLAVTVDVADGESIGVTSLFRERRPVRIVVWASKDALARARAELGKDEQIRAVIVRMDVTDSRSIDDAHRNVKDRLGAVDVLVNNAAVLLFENDDVLSIPTDGYRRTFDTNVFGVIDVCRPFAPDMVQRRYGRIVNVSSGDGQLAKMSTYAPAYSMSKTALNAFTRILGATYKGMGCW